MPVSAGPSKRRQTRPLSSAPLKSSSNNSNSTNSKNSNYLIEIVIVIVLVIVIVIVPEAIAGPGAANLSEMPGDAGCAQEFEARMHSALVNSRTTGKLVDRVVEAAHYEDNEAMAQSRGPSFLLLASFEHPSGVVVVLVPKARFGGLFAPKCAVVLGSPEKPQPVHAEQHDAWHTSSTSSTSSVVVIIRHRCPKPVLNPEALN